MTQEQFYSLPDFARFREAGEGFKFLLAAAYRKRLEQRMGLLKAVIEVQEFESLGRAIGCCAGCAQGMGIAFARAEIRLIQ